MDNVTHTLTGLMLARAGLGKSADRGGALMLMLAANVPDVDVFYSGFPGGMRYLEFHRGYTHSLLLVPVMALVPLFLARWISKSKLGWGAYFACIAGVLSHLAMDLTNVYGVRLLLPFSSRWLRLDITDIVDPWIVLILLLAIAAPALAGLVSSEISGKKPAGPKRGWAVFALIAILAYEGFREASHARALAMMGSRSYGQQPPTLIAAFPGGFSPLRWRGVVETPDEVLNLRVGVTEDFDPGSGEVDYPAMDSPAIEAARRTPAFQGFAKFNQVPFWKAETVGDNTQVQLIDLRFGTPQRPGFATSALIAPDGGVIESRFGLGQIGPAAAPRKQRTP